MSAPVAAVALATKPKPYPYVSHAYIPVPAPTPRPRASSADRVHSACLVTMFNHTGPCAACPSTPELREALGRISRLTIPQTNLPSFTDLNPDEVHRSCVMKESLKEPGCHTCESRIQKLAEELRVYSPLSRREASQSLSQRVSTSVPAALPPTVQSRMSTIKFTTLMVAAVLAIIAVEFFKCRLQEHGYFPDTPSTPFCSGVRALFGK